MRNVFTAADGRKLAFCDTQGPGLAVLCLAGLSRNMADFSDLARHLSPRYRVIRMDYRGRGQSAFAADPIQEYTPLVEGQDAVALLDHLGVGRAVVIGTSRGGLIGMFLAAGMPARIAGLVLNDIGPVVEQAGLVRIMSRLGHPPDYPDFHAAAAALREFYQQDFPDLDAGQWLAYARRSFDADDQGRPRLAYDPRLRDAVAAAMDQPPVDLWPVWEAIKCPVLAIRGANSDILSPETLAAMARRGPPSTTVTVPDRGHVPFLDEAVARNAIDVFLADLVSAAPGKMGEGKGHV